MKTLISLLVALLFVGGSALAQPNDPMLDKDGDKKKAEKDWEDAEERQKKGGQAPGEGEGGAQQGGGGPAFENPLEKILKLMQKVESRLYDADSGDYTQEEQRKILEAMKFEDKTSAALEELINQVEKQQQQQQQQQQKKQQKQKQKNQRKNETKQQRQERERREKEEERKRKPRAKKDEQQRKKDKAKRDKERKERQERQEMPPPRDRDNELNNPDGRAARWGQLPTKLHQDANNAANQAAPERWRELIKRYRQRLADVEK